MDINKSLLLKKFNGSKPVVKYRGPQAVSELAKRYSKESKLDEEATFNAFSTLLKESDAEYILENDDMDFDISDRFSVATRHAEDFTDIKKSSKIADLLEQEIAKFRNR